MGQEQSLSNATFVLVVVMSIFGVVAGVLGSLAIVTITEMVLIPRLGLNGMISVLMLWQAVNTGLSVAAIWANMRK